MTRPGCLCCGLCHDHCTCTHRHTSVTVSCSECPPDPPPPPGVCPRVIWQRQCNQQRASELLAAIERFAQANQAPQAEWFEELRDIWGLKEAAQ